MSLILFSSFPLLSRCHHPSPDHQTAAAPGPRSPARCCKGFHNLVQPPYLADSQTLKPCPPLQPGWAPDFLERLVSTS